MATESMGAIDGGTVDSAHGTLNAAPPLELGGYLQGDLNGLKGAWVINATGLVDSGTYPDLATLTHGASYWSYTASADPQWVQLTVP
jgi:hypothetical protein